MTKETLGEFEFLVLLAVLRLGPEAYGVSIVEEIRRRTGRAPSRASVYLTLQRLERAGLAASHLGAPLRSRGGKARRYVTLLPDGVRLLRATRERLESMWEGLELEEHLEELPPPRGRPHAET